MKPRNFANVFCRSAWTGAALVLLAITTGCHVAATGHNLEGKRLYEQGQYNASLASFQEALKDDPKNADAFYNTGAVYHRLGSDSGNQEYLIQAQEMYDRAIEIEPNHVDAYRGLAVLYTESGNPTAGFDLIESWVIRNPKLADPRIELARLYREKGDLAAARDHLSTALQHEPTNDRALRASGQVQEALGNYTAAIQMYERAFAQNSLQPELTAHMASLRQSLGVTAPPSVDPNGTRMVRAGTSPLRY